MKHLITKNDGTVCIMTMAEGHENVDPQTQIDQWHESKKSEVKSFRQIDDSEIPDRTFRNAWVDNGGKISIDMAKAKTIVDQSLRNEMSAHIKELDLLNKMGRDISSINKKIKECSDKVSQLDALSVSGVDDKNSLETLKSLKG